MKPMPRSLWIAVFAGVLLCLVLAVWGRASSGHVLILIGVTGALAGLAALSGLLHLVFRRRTRALGRCSIGLLVMAGLALCSFPLGAVFLSMDVSEAREYCDRLATKLDTARAEEGAYPVNVSGLLGSDEDLPRLLRDHQFYISDGEFYVISFDERNAMYPDEHMYESDSRSWATR